MSLQKKLIVEKALALLERDGLEGVTLRRVAAALHVKASSLYWHVQSKRDLLDEMAELMLETQMVHLKKPDKNRTWQYWLRGIANDLRETLLAYRDGGLVVAGANPNREKTFAKLGAYILTTLHQTYDVDLETAGILCPTIIIYTWASVIEEQTSPTIAEIMKNGPAILQYLSKTMIRDFSKMKKTGMTTKDFFNKGLTLILAGTKVNAENMTNKNK